MLKTETVTARSINAFDVLSDGNVLLEKSYSSTDDKFILVFQRMENVRKAHELMEQGTTEADDLLCEMWVNDTTMIVSKPKDEFQIVPEEAQF